MSLAAVAMPFVALVKMRFIDHLEVLRGERFVQLLGHSLCGGHRLGLAAAIRRSRINLSGICNVKT
jgi:hypothetical protein